MLEVLTMQYSQLPQGTLIAIGYGLIILGGVLYAIFGRWPAPALSRSHYFMLGGFAFALLAASQLLWFLYVPAIKVGLSGLLLLTDVAGSLALGAYSAHICVGRSLDAYGHGGKAWLGFVPLANLVLLFAPSQTQDPQAQRGSVGLAVVGLVLFGIGRGITLMIENSADGVAAQVANDPEAIAAIRAVSIRADGIEQSLDVLIAAEVIPLQISPTLLLSTVTRVGSLITYDYILDEPGVTSLTPDFHRQVHDNLCAALMPYLQGGASAAIRFTRSDRALIETLDLSLTECTT